MYSNVAQLVAIFGPSGYCASSKKMGPRDLRVARVRVPAHWLSNTWDIGYTQGVHNVTKNKHETHAELQLASCTACTRLVRMATAKDLHSIGADTMAIL